MVLCFHRYSRIVPLILKILSCLPTSHSGDFWSAAACCRLSRFAGPDCWPEFGVKPREREQARGSKAAASCLTPKRFANFCGQNPGKCTALCLPCGGPTRGLFVPLRAFSGVGWGGQSHCRIVFPAGRELRVAETHNTSLLIFACQET